ADSQFETYRVLSNHFVDSLKGLETLKYLGLSHDHEGKIASVSSRYRKATMKTLRVAFMSSFALDFFTMLSIALVALFLGLGLIDGNMNLPIALSVLILAP
ncbi:thiol reductant ABC exporter subunit CydD, partial [Escherichia coli]|nr:thiol reductant ABC exporter subunit CydD [Escherichia coli]